MFRASTNKVIAILRRDADLHDQGLVQQLGADFDEVDSSLEPGSSLRGLPWIFYDSWIDERNHDFPGFYKGITKSDWPTLARILADNLEKKQDITEPRLLSNFSPRRSFLSKITQLFKRSP